MKTLSRVLLVDDNLINLKVTSCFLKECDLINIDLAYTGKEAIKLFQKNEYSLILLDIGLPDISGIEVCRTMRYQQCINDMPIIAVTAQYDMKDECLLAGFDDFISKPLEFDILKRIIKKWIIRE